MEKKYQDFEQQKSDFKKNPELEKNIETEIGRIQEAYQMLIALGGEDFAREKMQEIAQLKDKEGIDREKAVYEALKKMQELGFLEKPSEGEDFWVADLEKFKTQMNSEFNRQFGQLFSNKKFGARNQNKFLALLFEGDDKRVVSKEDYANGVREPKNLFYLPKNKDEALDLEKIRKAEFYLNLFETTKRINFETASYGLIPDKNSDPQNGLDYREAFLALAIYHPQYGDGYRDPQNGTLYIRRRDRNGEYDNISAQYLEEFLGSHLGSELGENLFYPKEFVEKKLKNLSEQGLLKADDFRVLSTGSSAERSLFGRRFRQRGVVMFNSMEHIVGNCFDPKKAPPGSSFTAFQVDPQTGWVMEIDQNGKKKIKATFSIFEKDERFRTDSGNYIVKTGETNMIGMDNFYQKQKWETQEAFEERMDKWGRVLEVAQKDPNRYFKAAEYLSQKAGINIAKLEPRDQKAFSNLIEVFDAEKDSRLESFLQQYGVDGLRTFSSLENDHSMGERILEIGEKMNPFAARLVFRKYGELLDLVYREEDELALEFSKKGKDIKLDPETIRKNLLQKADAFLLEMFQRKKIKKQLTGSQGEINEISDRLSLIEKEMIFSAEVYKDAKKRTGLEEDLSIEDVSGSQFDQFFAADFFDSEGRFFDSEKKDIFEEMRRIYFENYSQRPKLQKALLDSFEKKLKIQGEKTRVFSYSLNGRVVAFCRFDFLPDGKIYFGAMNIHSEIKGKSIGTSFIRKALQEMEKMGQVSGECIPGEDISSWYIRDQKFVVDGIIDDYSQFGEDFIFKIQRESDVSQFFFQNSPRENEATGSPDNLSQRRILDWYAKNKSEEKDGRIVFQFPIKRKVSAEMYPEKMKTTLREYINEKGFVMSGYFFGQGEKEDERIAYCALERPASSGSN